MKVALGRYDDGVRERVEALVAAGAAGRIWRQEPSFWGGDARQRSVADRLGWLNVAARMRERAGDLRRFAERVRTDGFRDAVLLGMGGSSLAPEVIRRSFGRRPGWPTLHVLDTTDPATIGVVTSQIDLARTLFCVSSKSGTTIEALSLFRYFYELVRAVKGDGPGESFVAVTDEGTPLQDLAHEHGFRHVFINPSDIGGRYSALSYFGLVPAAVMGVNVEKLLDRGIAAAEEAKSPDSDALRLGAAFGQLALRGRDKATFVVAPSIAAFGLWVEQLIAESTGKEGRGLLPVADEPLGTPRHYGDDRVFVELRAEGDSTGEEDAAVGALRADGQPVITIELEDAYDLGREFFSWEFAVAVAGRVLDVNPFDEPNVQESKDNTNRVLKAFAETGKLDIDGIDASDTPVALTAPDRPVTGALPQVVAELLAGMGEHDYFAVTAYIQQTAETDAAFREIRAAVRDARGVATTLGYGPRFLHSTGQLHKGGPPRGVFLQVTASDAVDLAIPGAAYTFGQLKRAQAIGDFQALLEHRRPVLRVHLGRDIAGGLAALRYAVQAATR